MDGMILGPVSYIDCAYFVLWLMPTLLSTLGRKRTVAAVWAAIPFLIYHLPLLWYHERVRTPLAQRHLFAQKATFFEYLVTRCVKWAFTHLGSEMGRVFLGPDVAEPFLRFRMLRHGFLKYPYYRKKVVTRNSFRGIDIRLSKDEDPDIVIYYIHGGGFTMGCPEFYEEFLVTWLTLLKQAGYSNPALFALDYTLVPDARYPTQTHEVINGYRYIIHMANDDASRVVLAGDSAGAQLALSLIVGIGRSKVAELRLQAPCTDTERYNHCPPPQLVVLISPWVTLASSLDRTTPSDYLDAEELHRYALEYVAKVPQQLRQGETSAVLRREDLESVSPGHCMDPKVWRAACPNMYVTYGSEEVFVGAIRKWLDYLASETKVRLNRRAEIGGVHAWPVASLFLGSTQEQRFTGLRGIVEEVRECVPPGKRVWI